MDKLEKRKKFKRERYELVVVGGGMAGVCTAIAAARHGVRTALIHARPVLGGNASSEIRMHICGADENGHKPDLTEGGILHEILLKNKSRNPYFSYAVWDAVLYETVKAEPNVTLYMNTVTLDCRTENDVIRSVECFCQTTEYHLEIEGDYFADCTGNGTLGFFAGAEYREGSEARAEFDEPHAPDVANGDRMGNTILFKAVKRDAPVVFEPPSFAKKLTEEQLRFRMHSEFHTVDASSASDPEAFVRASTGSTTAVDYGYWWIELMGEGEDFVGQYEAVKDELIAYVWGMWDHIKNGGEHGAAYYDLEWVGALPGMRESRRLIGDYILNERDIFENRVFDDAVAYGGWPVDVHCPHGLLDFDRLPSEVYSFSGAYTIPWRCYYSKSFKNLTMAGRDISVTRLGLGSTRIMGTCSVGGQAVGTAIALCKKYGCSPRELAPHIHELRQLLLEDDGYIPGAVNEDERDIARTSAIEASSWREGFEPKNVVNGVSRPDAGGKNMWRSCGIGAGGEWLRLKLTEAAVVERVQLTFDSCFGRAIRITLSDKRRAQQRAGVPEELVKTFSVELLLNGEIVASKRISENILRMCRVDMPKTLCDTVRLRFEATHGCEDIRVFEVRIRAENRNLSTEGEI